MAAKTRGLITSGDKKYKKLGAKTKTAEFETSTELSIAGPGSAGSNRHTTGAVYTSPRSESFELYPGE